MRSICLPIRLIKGLLIPLILFSGFVGVSYSFFTERTDIGNRLSMGDINVVFSDLYISESSPGSFGISDARIVNSGKNIDITIADALPGYFTCICFEVKNIGTVPVVYELSNIGGDGIMSVSAGSGCIYAGGTSQGQINISVGNPSGESTSLYLELNFQQAIVEKKQ